MQVKEIFQKGEDISLENYLLKCGVKDVEKYLKPDESMIESFNNYKNGGDEEVLDFSDYKNHYIIQDS